MATVTADRPTCLHCDREPAAAAPALLGTHCRTRLAANLGDLARTYPRLDPTPGSDGLQRGRATPGFGSRSPARDDVLSLTDPRDAADPDDSQNASVPAVIGWWGDRCREEGLLGPRRTPRAAVAGECAAILGVLGAVACRWWVADLAAAVEAVAWRVRSALGEVEPRWVRVDAPCPDCTLVTLVRFTATGAVQCTACRFVAAGEVFGGWLAGVVAGVVADDGVGDHRVDVSS